LDNVLDLTFWPLAAAARGVQAKRRIGVGFTGMGNALAMLCLRYDAPDGREMAARIAAQHAGCGVRASVALAREKGTFPKFEADGLSGNGHVCQPPADAECSRPSAPTASATATCCRSPRPAP
jgi:ribonucleoside-diphosphate reductase alpha chain